MSGQSGYQFIGTGFDRLNGDIYDFLKQNFAASGGASCVTAIGASAVHNVIDAIYVYVYSGAIELYVGPDAIGKFGAGGGAIHFRHGLDISGLTVSGLGITVGGVGVDADVYVYLNPHVQTITIT